MLDTVTCTVTVPEKDVENFVAEILGQVEKNVFDARDTLTMIKGIVDENDGDQKVRQEMIKEASDKLNVAWHFLKESIGVLYGLNEHLESINNPKGEGEQQELFPASEGE